MHAGCVIGALFDVQVVELIGQLQNAVESDKGVRFDPGVAERLCAYSRQASMLLQTSCCCTGAEHASDRLDIAPCEMVQDTSCRGPHSTMQALSRLLLSQQS